MKKQWENPTIESMGFEQTECGRWKYLYNCTNIGNGCNYYDFSPSPNLERACDCGGFIRVVDKHWSESYCDGTCS